ncbi:DUF4157 domain-containing protein [Anaerolineae bacterium CFX9]|nr:DUF4157 domain-containing protein [Anaerolineae bacterium CFX9]
MKTAVQKRSHRTPEQHRHKPRRSASTHERQAQDAAARLMSGEQDVARLLTHVPAAPQIAGLHSGGTPLPGGLRETLEAGFGADLGAVRLFHDAEAAALAADEAALAFTSGRDIFFAEGQYQPGSRDGQRLIAHEVAHVLQQTGRRSSAGTLRASVLHGSGDFQHDEPPEPSFDIDLWKSGFRAIAVNEGLPQEEIDGLNDALSALETALGKDKLTEITLKSGKAGGVIALEREVLDKKWDGKPAFALTMLLDAFKIMGRHAGAVYLLEKEPLLQTTGFWVPFAQYLDAEKGEDWFVGAFKDIPQISAVFPDYLEAALWRYLMHPHEPPTASPGIEKLSKEYLDHYEKIKFSVPLKDNERMHGAYHYLRQINRDFEKLLASFDSTFGDLEPSYRRRAIASVVVTMLTQWETDKHLAKRLLSAPLMTVAKRAKEYWDRAETLLAIITGEARRIIDPEAGAQKEAKAPAADQPVGTTPEAKAPAIPPEVLKDPVFARFLTDTDAGLLAVLGGTTPALLDAPAYQTALDALRKGLGKHRTALSKAIDSFFRRQNLDDQVMFERAVWYAVAQLKIDHLMTALNDYDKGREGEFDKRYGGLPDVRLHHRYQMAREALRFAGMSGSGDLKAAAQQVNDGKDLGYSYLAFIGEWKRDTTDVNKLRDDFDDDLAVGGFGGTIENLRHIYYLLRQRALISALTQLLDTYKSSFELETYGLIAQAQEAAEAEVPYPARWLPEKSFLVWHSSDAEHDERGNLNTLIKHHPRYGELLRKQENAERVPLISVHRPSYAVVWMLPHIEKLRAYLYGIPALSRLVEHRTGAEPTLEELSSALSHIVQEAREAAAERLAREQEDPSLVTGKSKVERELDALLLEIGGTIATEIFKRHKERRGLFVKATIHDRMVIEKAAGDLLDIYAADPGITNYSVPMRAIEFIEHFSRNILPDTRAHQQAQMTLLMLSLAPKLQSAFIQTNLFGSVTETRYDIITSLWPLLNDAIDYADGKFDLRQPTDTPHAAADVRASLQPYLNAPESADTLLARRKTLAELRDALLKQVRRVQTRSGMRGSTSPQALRRVDLDRELPVGENAEPFMIDGITYSITKVERDFKFHPSYGMRGSASYIPSILVDGNGDPIPRDLPVPLVTYIINNGEPETLTSLPSDEAKLEQLAHATTMHLLMISMQETAALIQAGTQIGMNIVALIVPGGQLALTAVELATFMATDMPTIRTDLIDAPMALVHALDEFVSPEMRDRMVEKFWNYLLFEGDLPFAEKVMAASTKKDKTPASSSRRQGKFGKVAEFAKNAGLRLLKAFLALRQRIRSGMIRASRVVKRHTLLMRLLRVLPQIISYGSRIKGKDIDTATELLGDLAEGNAPEMISKQFREALDQLIEGLNGLAVPAEILPLELIADVVLERFLKSLGIKGKVINLALETIQVRQMVSETVAKSLKEHGADPNILWQQLAQEKLQAMLVDTRAELLAGVNQLLKTYLGDFYAVSTADLPPIELTKDAALPEMEPLLLPKRDAEQKEDEEETAQQPAPRINPLTGQPLSPAAKLRYEKLFGHDLAHVRLHSDSEAAKLTRRYRANALTSGSHIFLSEETPPTSPRADRVLRHEIAHVLQQTGARPLGFPNRAEPRLGAIGRGLTMNPRREHAADRMARQAQTRGDSPVPVEEEAPLAGLMPELSDALKQQVIRYLGSDALADSFVEQVDSLHAIPSEISVKQRGQFEAALREADTVWKAVHKQMKAGTGGKTHPNPAPFNEKSALEAFQTFFSGKAFDIDRVKLRALTFFSYREAADRLRLDYSRFKANLENYIFGKTGIDLRIHYRTAAAVDKSPDVSHVNVVNVDLGELFGNPKPWSTMRANTNDFMKAHVATMGAPFTDSEWQKIRENLKGGTTDRDPWDNKEYRLSEAFIKEMREFVNASVKGQVGKWENYVDTADVPNQLYGGLRIGTHGQLTGNPTGRADLEPALGTPGGGEMSAVARGGRQSHHVPQFLLVEYFENDNKTKVSREIGGRQTFPPGFDVKGGRAAGFDDGSGKKIDFAKLDPQPSNRGTGLPAISLAAKTHQKGQLHINAVSTWGDYRDPKPNIEIKGSSTQGATINETFYKLMRDELGYGKSGSDADILTRAHSDPTARPKIHKAIQKTYRWMYRGMKQAMERTLTRSVTDAEHWEAVSYRTFALSMPDTTIKNKDGTIDLKPDYQPRDKGLREVIAAIEAKNRFIMKEWWIE